MVTRVLLSTQVGQDFLRTPASQNVWLAGMAEGLAELGFSVSIPIEVSSSGDNGNHLYESTARRFLELYGVGGANLEFFDSRELATSRLPKRFDVLWTRDPALLAKKVDHTQTRIAEYHGGSREASIPELAASQSVPLITVTESWLAQYGASALAEPGALKVFFKSQTSPMRSGSQEANGLYVGGLDPDRIDGVGIRALSQILRSGSRIDVVGGNLNIEVAMVRFRLARWQARMRFFGYLPPTISAQLMHSAGFAVALKAENSAPSAPIKLIAFAAAGLPIVGSRAFLRRNFSGVEARQLQMSLFAEGANPRAHYAVEAALDIGAEAVAHNYQIALDNTFRRRIEKTGLLRLIS